MDASPRDLELFLLGDACFISRRDEFLTKHPIALRFAQIEESKEKEDKAKQQLLLSCRAFSVSTQAVPVPSVIEVQFGTSLADGLLNLMIHGNRIDKVANCSLLQAFRVQSMQRAAAVLQKHVLILVTLGPSFQSKSFVMQLVPSLRI